MGRARASPYNRSKEEVIFSNLSLFKLAQGEYISPEKIEICLSKNEMIEQCFVYGESLKASLVAVVVPNEENLVSWCKKQGHDVTFDEACKLKQVKEYFLEIFNTFGKNGSKELKGFEIPKNVFVEKVLFSNANSLLTDTFKLKRFEAKKHYAEQIAQMYSEIKE